MKAGLTRREMATALLAGVAATLTPRIGRAVARSGPSRRPKKLVQIALDGGCDWLYTVDPKTARDVRAGVGPIYKPDELLAAGNARFGPMWKPLEKYLPRIQVINGIQVGTVAHETGQVQMRQLRRDVVSMRDETALTVAGRALQPASPLHSLHIGPGEAKALPENDHLFVDSQKGPLLAALHAVANDDALRGAALEALARTMKRGDRAPASFLAVEHLVNRMRGTKAPAMTELGLEERAWPPWFPPEKGRGIESREAMQFEWALYALEHDLSPTVYFASYYWDTHTQNEILQGAGHRHFALRLAHFLDRLAAIDNGHGQPLLDEVGILITSELGRFPYVNPQAGKDHFPQVSAVLIGPGLTPGAFGQTGDETAALDVSLRTGRPSSSGSQLTLDDLGRTMMEWVGVADPKAAGYSGRVLEFSFA